jgi:hypothetical protein
MRSLNKVFFPVLVIAAAIALFFAACEVGLGEAVDANPPSLSITYPPENAVIREEFLLRGTAADDTGVRNVSVTLLNTATNKSYPGGSVSPNGNDWSMTVNSQKVEDGGGDTLLPYS